jgi:acetylornithine deacetylase
MWTHPPFEPVIEGDWLYGRGGADMKAGHAANLFALDALRRVGLQPAATLYLQSVVEDESTGNGALMTHLRGYKADAVLIPEPEDEKLVRANVGVLWFSVDVRGMPVHVREMGAGANAIDAAYRIIGELRRIEEEWNAAKAGREHFESEDHPINLPARSKEATGLRPCRRGAGWSAGSRSIQVNRLMGVLANSATASPNSHDPIGSSPTYRRP